jgi:predicted permease
MNLIDLFTLQGTLFLLMLLGALLKKIGFVTDEGKRCLSNLVVYVILPCTIFKSCFVETGPDFFKTGSLLLFVSLTIEVASLGLNRILYNRYDEDRRKVLKYGTIVPNSGFLGTPIAEGIFHELGILYSAIFLIPVRIFMWSFGTSYFIAQEGMSKKRLIFKVATHPCLIAVFLSLVVMFFEIPVPPVIQMTVNAVAKCNSAIAMFVIGTILAEAKTWKIFDRHSLYYCFVRLGLLPAMTLLLGKSLGLSEASLGVAILMMGMPAGATTSIFPSQYGGDYRLGTACVVESLLLSMITLPLWIHFMTLLG